MANDGSIEITITGNADELKKEIEAVSKATTKQTTQAQKSTKGVKSETDTLKKSLELLGSAGKNAYNGLKTVGETAMKTIATATATAEAAIATVGAAVVSVGSSFESAMSEVEAISGATSKEMKMLEDAAISAGASTVFSASEAAAALKYMSLAGWDAEKSAKELDGVLSLAAASGMELASASDMVTDYLSAFSNSAITAAEFADLLAYAQSNSNTTAEQLGEAYKNCAANLNAAGQDVQTVTSLLEAMANQGLKGSEAGTKLKAMMRDLTASMEDGKITINDTAIAVQDSKGNFRDLTVILADIEKATKGMGDAEKAAALSTIFTDESVSGLNLVLNEGVSKIAGYEKELRNCEGTAADMADTMTDNLQGDITLMNSALESFGIAVYQEMNEPLREIVQAANGYVGQLADAFSKGGFEGVVKEAGGIIPEIITAISKQAPKLIDLGFTLLDGIIEGIEKNAPALADTGLKIVTQIFDGIKNMSTNLMPLVGDFANVFVQGVLKYKDVFWSVAFDMVTAIAQGLSDHADDISSGIVTLINNIVAKMDESLPVFIEAASNILINVFETLAENMPDIADNLSKMLSNICKTLFESLPTLFESASNLIISVFEMLAKNMPDIAENLSKMITKICDLLAKNLPKIIEAAGDFLEAFINELLGHANEIFNSVKGIISSLFSSFTTLTPKVKTIVGLLATLYAAKGVSKVISAIGSIQGVIKNLFTLISNHPVGAVISAIGLLTGAIGTLYSTFNSSRSTQYSDYLDDVAGRLEEVREQAKKVKEKYDDMKEARDEVVSSNSSEFEYYDNLWDELQGLVDQNGKVKKGYEDRVKFIEGELNRVCGENGVEWGIADGIITKNGEVVTSTKEIETEMQNLLTLSKGQSLLGNLEDSYTTATQELYGKDGVEIKYYSAQNDYAKYSAELKKLEREKIDRAAELREILNAPLGTYSFSEINEARTKSNDAKEAYLELEEKVNGESGYKEVLEDMEKAYYGHLQTIDQYSDLEAAVMSNDVDAINDAIDNITYDFKTAKNATQGELEQQIIDYDAAIDELNELSANGYNIDEEALKTYKRMRNKTKEQLDLMLSDYGKYQDRLENAQEVATNRQLANDIYKAFLADEDGNGDGWGAEIGTSLFNGIIAGLQESSSMKDQNLAMVLDTQIRQARKALGINSPSKVTKRVLGKPMGQGVTVGNVEAIKEGAKDVEKALDDDLLKPLSKKSFTLSPSVILSAQQAARSTAQRAASSVTTTNIHNITNNAYSQAQQTNGDGYVQESVISFERGVNDLVDFLAPKIETRTRRVGRKAVAKLG